MTAVTRRPADLAQPVTAATWARVGPNSAANRAGLTNRPYIPEPGVDTAVANRASAAGSRPARYNRTDTSTRRPAAPASRDAGQPRRRNRVGQ